EPRDRDQEPRGLRGAGGDDPDRGAPGARGPRPDEARARGQALGGGPLGADGLRRPLVLAAARGARRIRRPDAGARHRRGARPAAAGGRGRQRAPLRARALLGDAELVRDRRDVPARRRGGLHPARLARGGAGGCARAGGARVTLWAGRVEGELAPEVWELVKADDAELFPYDVEGTRLHARRLAVAGLLAPDELAEVEARLSALDPAMIEPEDEDVHSAIERLLGDLGRKIHAGRSRNDQVVTAFRLWGLDACAEATAAIGRLAYAILDRADEHADTLMPGYTHLQRAQPVTV